MLSNISRTKNPIYMFTLFIILFYSSVSFASTIVIAPNTVISSPTAYISKTLDMSHGSFIIKNNARLTITNCEINGVISATNPFLIQILEGSLTLSNNQISVVSSGLVPDPQNQSLYQVLQIEHGTVNINQNNISVDQPYVVGFLVTNSNVVTDGFSINDNAFKNFHGGLYLVNSNHASVMNNVFHNVSFSNILNIGKSNNLKRNRFILSGNLNLGDAIDVFSSENVTVSDNSIESPSCVGVNIANSHNIVVDNNKISDGVTYGITVVAATTFSKNVAPERRFLSQIMRKYNLKALLTQNITIVNNYLSQNRFGVAADGVDGLLVQNNLFVQRFSDAVQRLFWTNNENLLKNVTNLTWIDNLYKEGYSQDNDGDNSKSYLTVTFPMTGGVIL